MSPKVLQESNARPVDCFKNLVHTLPTMQLSH